MNRIVEAFREVEAEYHEASANFPPFNSAHEGYAVILEEVRELEKEVFKNKKRRDVGKMREEAIQVGAMALRFVVDVCGERGL